MICYLAARYGRRREIRIYADALRAEGHTVIARWLDGVHEAADGDTTKWGRFAQDDLDDIDMVNTVISFTETGLHPRGSRHVEFGYALATGKQVVVIGPVENVFHALPCVMQFDTWAHYMAAMLEDRKSI